MGKKKKKKRSSATLLHERHFRADEFTQAAPMAHCDGLVLLPTDTKTYVFNPATRDSISLPESSRNMMRQEGPRTCLPTGLGYDASTGRYKVARAFYRSGDYSHTAMGMEVFTINGGDDDGDEEEDGNWGWRETHEDSPCLVWCPQTPLHHKGHLFYFTDTKNQQPSSLPLGLLRFSLASETFGFTPLLTNMFPPRAGDDDGSIVIHELDGELCATFFCKQARRLFVWVARDVLDPRWGLRYTIHVSERFCYPVASLGANGGFLMRRRGRNCLIRYYEQDHQQAVKEDGVF
ncbi:uncharacterized protein LOC112268701 [Brachypodium distachyon]|uniref:uncharacterized protein LOC112268701 n=1 Tax=Brachypodium distachyon TaxID=15368 RepID=UPI0001C71A69|nr:uncharacterized protein LOC112268701 [Brachypodium distachyon]|eukprot:XP_024310430.1 uncharacterized protein LOC112268701 [Brachypodium distachyon]